MRPPGVQSFTRTTGLRSTRACTSRSNAALCVRLPATTPSSRFGSTTLRPSTSVRLRASRTDSLSPARRSTIVAAQCDEQHRDEAGECELHEEPPARRRGVARRRH